MTALWMPVNDVAGEQSTIAAAKRWQSKLFTSSGTWTVPADVGVIWIDGCGGGAGGGGGFASDTSGGGGGGGASSTSFVQYHMPVSPGETLTITVGAGGAGAAAGAASVGCTSTTVAGSIGSLVSLGAFGGGFAGTATLGGSASGYGAVLVAGTANNGTTNITAFIGTDTTSNQPYAPRYTGVNTAAWQAGAAGGGPGYAGGASSGGAGMASTIRIYVPSGAATGVAGNGLGAGGSGGNGLYGVGGAGGAGGAAGANATGYGAGGGGGGGNAAGGNGSPGFIRIYCFSATTI